MLFRSFINLKSQTDSLVKELLKESERWKNLKITGWIQPQLQFTDSSGAKNFDGGDFLPNSDKRFIIRRGRVKFTYSAKNSQYVMQLNATERGVNLVEAYLKVTDPLTKSFILTAGTMNRPYSFEIQQSSADRETPERSRYLQIITPNERDLGMMLTYQPVAASRLYGLKIDAGLFNGTGIAVPGTTSLNGAGVVDPDYIKDFISRIHFDKASKNNKIKFGIGSSLYYGGVLFQNNHWYNELKKDTSGNFVWTMQDTVSNPNMKGRIAPRRYYAGDVQFSIKSGIGVTTIRAEYAQGQQSSTKDENKSWATLLATPDVYTRNFNAGCAYFIQRIGNSKHELVCKYEWYDPNTELKGNQIASSLGFTKAEIKYNATGLGYNYYYDEHVKFMFYYNIVKNEATRVVGYTKDVRDNVFTMRVQYRF